MSDPTAEANADDSSVAAILRLKALSNAFQKDGNLMFWKKLVASVISIWSCVLPPPSYAQSSETVRDNLRGYWAVEKSPYCANEYTIKGNEMNFRYADEFVLHGSAIIVTKWGNPESVTITSVKGNRVTATSADGKKIEYRLDKGGNRLTITAGKETVKLVRCNYFGEPVTQKAKEEFAAMIRQSQQFLEERRAMMAERAEARRESCLRDSESCVEQCRSELLSCRSEVPSYRKLEDRNEARVMCTTSHGRCLKACGQGRRTC